MASLAQTARIQSELSLESSSPSKHSRPDDDCSSSNHRSTSADVSYSLHLRVPQTLRNVTRCRVEFSETGQGRRHARVRRGRRRSSRGAGETRGASTRTDRIRKTVVGGGAAKPPRIGPVGL